MGMRVSRAVEKKVVGSFICPPAGRTMQRTDLANSMQEHVERGMTCPQLHKHTCLHSG